MDSILSPTFTWVPKTEPKLLCGKLLAILPFVAFKMGSLQCGDQEFTWQSKKVKKRIFNLVLLFLPSMRREEEAKRHLKGIQQTGETV